MGWWLGVAGACGSVTKRRSPKRTNTNIHLCMWLDVQLLQPVGTGGCSSVLWRSGVAVYVQGTLLACISCRTGVAFIVCPVPWLQACAAHRLCLPWFRLLPPAPSDMGSLCHTPASVYRTRFSSCHECASLRCCTTCGHPSVARGSRKVSPS